MDSLLIEIGTEEIPAGYIGPALQSLAVILKQKLTEARIDQSDGQKIARHAPLGLLQLARRLGALGRFRQAAGGPLINIAPRQQKEEQGPTENKDLPQDHRRQH